MKLIIDGNFPFLRFFLDFFKFIISARMKVPLIFFPVIKTRFVAVTKNGKDTPEHCCGSELMDRENYPN